MKKLITAIAIVLLAATAWAGGVSVSTIKLQETPTQLSGTNPTGTITAPGQAFVSWGDGTITTYTGTDTAWSHTYSGEGPWDVTILAQDGDYVSGNWAESGGTNTISYVNQSTGHSDTAYGNLVLDVPSSTSDGDIMIATVTDDNGGTVTCSGWTSIANPVVTGIVSIGVLYKIASSEPSDYTFTSGSSNRYFSGVIMTFSKSGGTWNIPDSSSIGVSDFYTSITTDSVTTTNPSYLICAYGNDDDESVTAAPTDMTGTSVTSSGTTASMYYQSYSTAEAVTKTITYGGNVEELAAVAIVLEAQ